MPVRIREQRQPGETDEQFAARDEAHWKGVAEDEERVLRLRALWMPKKQGKARRV